MNLYLIGYRGSGKSTVAPLVAQALSASGPLWETVDADDAVEEIAGTSIFEIFSKFGEAKFRELESKVVESLSVENQLVVSLGGGAPVIEVNRRRIRATGKSIWLRAEAELLWERISVDHRSQQQRPNLTSSGGLDEVIQLLEDRNPIYAQCADFIVDIGRQRPQEIAGQIVEWALSNAAQSGW
ncbi:MAG: shikimate kinase [Mariniblastus sp.]|nr:shikimate kinase [Mariniblastus sp.]